MDDSKAWASPGAGSATKQWDSPIPSSLFFFLQSYPRLECKDTQIRGKGKKERMDGWMDGGNSIFIWKSGQAGKGEDLKNPFPYFYATGHALIDVTMASKSSPAIPHLL